MEIPVIAELRDTQNYIKASESGIGIHEMGAKSSEKDIEDWQKVVAWLDAGQQDEKLKVIVDNS